MARIAGVDLPRRKPIWIALTYIYGIGRSAAKKIVEKANLDPTIRAQDLTEHQVKLIREVIDAEYKVEGDLRREIAGNLKRLQAINCYRGVRHRRSLPVRGQRTSTNARTRKGPRKTVGVTKAAV